MQLRPIDQQVIVLTGASSGIGLVTARQAARKGAKLVLAARSEEALRELADEINHDTPGQAIAVTCDVTDADAVRRLRDVAIERFGRIDTWINDAGLGLFGKIVDVPMDAVRRLFETNVYGVMHGSTAFAEYVRDREPGDFSAALVNLGSVLSYQAIPMQGHYVSTKHAVKGFTDSLRLELEHDDVPVSVTCIMPNAINTPYADHAPNYMDQESELPPPVYAPETVARAILHSAAHPTRQLTIGGAFKPVTTLSHVLPRAVDWIMKTFMVDAQQGDAAAQRSRAGSLVTASAKTPAGAGRERGDDDRFTIPFSGYTQARMPPIVTSAVLAGAGLLVGALAKKLSED